MNTISEELRRQISALERSSPAPPDRPALPTGFAVLDSHLPWGGLPVAALHEVVADDGADLAAATGFLAKILSRTHGTILWCGPNGDLYAPGLAGLGLDPDRVVFAAASAPADILWAMEEGLRCPDLAAVVGEVRGLELTPARRLQLAAERGGLPCFLLSPFLTASSPALTRWQVRSLPSPRDRTAHWHVFLVRCRDGGTRGNWQLVSNL